jgi:hypothetical protein
MKWLRIQYDFPEDKSTVLYERLNPKIKWIAAEIRIHDYVHGLAASVADVSYRVVNRLPKKELARRRSEWEATYQEVSNLIAVMGRLL